MLQPPVNYAYFEAETTVDGENVTVLIDVRRSPQKNKLWVHRVYTKENTAVEPTGAESSKIGLINSRYSKSISQPDGSVNTPDEKKSLAKVDNGDSADRLEKLNYDSGVKFSKAKVDIGNKKSYTYNKYWHTDLTKNQIETVIKWLSAENNPVEKSITDKTYWYNGRINGEDLFVIYSTSDAEPTILYEIKGKNAKSELNILQRALEVIEYERSSVERKRVIDELFGNNWVRKEHDLANNNDRPRTGGSNTGNASVLQGKSSQFIGSQAFRNVVKNLFEIQSRRNTNRGKVKYSNSIPDSSDTAYLPKGEKPKSSTASLAALAKRNAVLNKRLADAKNQLKLTKAYSPKPGEIDALAERIASDYNNGENVKGIKTALTGIYRLWNEGKVTGDEYKLKQANREIASLAQDIMFGEDANVPSTEANNKAISQFADMLSTEIAFVAEAEPTFADKAKALLEYEREMAEIDKKEAVAKERLKAEQKAFEKAEKDKDKAERQEYVEFWNKELDKLDKQKAKSIEKAKAEVDRLHQIASRKSALHDMSSTWSATKEQINEIADGLISFYNKDAKKSKVASLVEKIYKARSFAQRYSDMRDVHLKNMNNYIDELTSVLSVRHGDSASIKSEIDNILYEIGRDSLTSFDKASMRGEAITAEINALRNARNAENAEETDAKINELRKEYAEVKASVASDGINSIIENTVKWSGKSVESLINTAVRFERRLQKDIAKQKIDDIRRRGTESKERQRLLKLMQRLKRVKTKPELMSAISEIIGDYDTVAVNITGRKIEELGTIQDEFLAEQKRLIVEGEAPKIMTQALKDKLARLDNKKIGDMSIEEVRSLTEALLEIETRVKAEKKLLNDEFKQTTKEAGRQIIKELNHEKAKGVDANLAEKKKSIDDNHMEKKKGVFANLLKKKNNGKYDHLRARTFFLTLCGYNENSTLYKLFDAVLEGRRNTLLYKQAQDNRLSPWTKDKEYMKTIIGKDAEGIDIGGGVKVNKASLIALYLHSMNDDNMRHIEHGGIEIPDFNLMKKGEIKEAYEKSKIDRVFLTKSEIYALCQKHLNERDKNLANAIRVYFNEVSKKVLNEVSLKVYGYEKFNVENYFPIRVDANFLNSDGTDIFDGEGNINILEKGFAQERQKGAITPMLLVDALTVFDRSVNDHALYANLAIPLRDMKAAFGVSVVSKPDDGKYRVETSVWTTLEENYGSDAETYIKDFWQNLQGKTVKELGDKRFNGAIGRLATSALYLNEQSALKQFTAYPVALAVLDTKSLGKALKDIGKIDEAKLERYNRYTPWLVHRSEGLSDATIADLRQGKKNHKWANWLQYTDVLTSKKLLKACEYYVKDNYKDIKPDTDAFYKKVAEKFNEVIEQTQQNNDVVSKTRRLNNQGNAMRMLTVFKSQNYQQLNMYIEAQGRVEAKELAYKNNKDSAVAKEAFEDAKLKRTRTVAGIQLSVAMNIAISLAMQLLRGRWDELDKDKDGEVEALEVLGNVLSRYFDEQSSMFLFGDVVSYAKDAITGGTPFTPSENPYIEPFVNTIDKTMKLVGEVEQWIRDGKFNGYELLSAVKGLSVETLKSIGVPAGNAYNLLTTSAFGSAFLLTGGSNDFAQIIRHTIKGDLISKSGDAEYSSINKDVKLALFRLHDADGKEELFDTAYGFMKFFGAEDVKIFDGLSDAYGKRADIYAKNKKTEEEAEALAYKKQFAMFSSLAAEFNEIAVTDEDKKLVSDFCDSLDKHNLTDAAKCASFYYSITLDYNTFDLPSITATRNDESPKDGYINKDINGVTIGMKLDTTTYIEFVKDVLEAEDEAASEASERNMSEKDFRKLLNKKVENVKKEYLLEHGSVIVKDKEKWGNDVIDDTFNTLQMNLLKLEPEEGKTAVSDNQKRKAILETDVAEDDKHIFYKFLLGGNDEDWKKESEKITAFEKAGLGFDDYLKARIEKYGIEQKGLKPAAEANEFYSWARDNYGDEKAKVIYSTLPASFGSVIAIADLSAANYADAGLSNDSTNKVLEALGGLEPLPGKSQVSDFQKASKIISLDLSDKEKMGGLKVVLDDGAYKKVESAYKLKIGLDVYYGIAGKYDTAADNYSALDDNGKKKMKEQLKRDGYGDMTPNQVSAYLIIEQYGAGLNKPQKAALWQLQNKSWKGDNNPYGENLGNAFRKNMGWD